MPATRRRRKNPVILNIPSGKKQPVITVQNIEPMQRKIRFRFDRVDVGGKWCVSLISQADLAALLKKLGHFETMTLSEAFFSGEEPGKRYPITSLSPGAQTRLQDISSDDLDEVARLRVGATQRLYGIRYENEFSILWWDPEHEICPSPLRHT
jgi:hypothetical protein